MSRFVNDFDSIKDVLRASIGSCVPIILVGGRRVVVEVIDVRGDLLVASVRCRVITININCICAVCICCEAILRYFLNECKRKRDREEDEDFECGSSRCRIRSRRHSRSHSRSRFSSFGEEITL